MNIAFAGFRHTHIYQLYRMAMKEPRIHIRAAWEEDAAAREAATKALDISFADGSYEALLARPDIDAIALGGCFGQRGGMAIAALRAGKHVIADKPLCTSLEELDAIEMLAKQQDRKVGCMLDLRYTSGTAAAKGVMDSGTLGEVRALAFTGQHSLDYGRRPSWYFEKGLHGGTINDIGIHGVDLVMYLTNLSIEETIAARCWNAYAVHAPHFKDCAQFMCRMNNGAGLIADVSYAAPNRLSYPLEQYWRFTLWCARGVMEFGMDGNVKVSREGSTEREILRATAPEANCLTDFLDDIHGIAVAHNTHSVLRATRATLCIQNQPETCPANEAFL